MPYLPRKGGVYEASPSYELRRNSDNARKAMRAFESVRPKAEVRTVVRESSGPAAKVMRPIVDGRLHQEEKGGKNMMGVSTGGGRDRRTCGRSP